MKKIFSSFIAITFFIAGASTQNVGIGTASPTEKLDVNGNINIAGQVKINGDSGTRNQVLMKDAANNLVWSNLSEFKNLQVFDCAGIAFTTGGGNCTTSWIVPVGVTTIFTEGWGGGGGGSTLTGGGGGAYISGRLTVTPGSTINLTIGAGGNYGSVGVYGINGGTSIVSSSGTTLQASGGQGGTNGDPLTSASGGSAQGGTFSTSGITNQYLGYYGNPGGISKISFMTAGTTDFAKIVNYGDGGDAGLLPGSGGKGGYKVQSVSITQTIYATQSAIQPGGGGGSDPTGGFYGRAGRIIIHW